MNLFENIKGALFETEPPAPAAPPATPVAPVPPQYTPQYSMPPGAGQPPYTVFPTSVAMTVDPEKLKELRDKVHPTAGPLVLFINTLTGLQQFIPDEVTRFRAAATTLQGQGVTIDAVTDELNAVLGRVEENRVQAEAAKGRKYETDVTARENRVAAIGTIIESKQAEIAALIAERDQVFGEAQSAKAKIEEKWAVWEAARQTIVAEYNDSLRKLKSYFATPTK